MKREMNPCSEHGFFLLSSARWNAFARRYITFERNRQAAVAPVPSKQRDGDWISQLDIPV